jgi:4-oxalocrotonate tautomerase
MPEVYIYANQGRTPEQKRGLLVDVTEAVVKNFGAKKEDVVVTIVENDPANKAKGGIPFNER